MIFATKMMMEDKHLTLCIGDQRNWCITPIYSDDDHNRLDPRYILDRREFAGIYVDVHAMFANPAATEFEHGSIRKLVEYVLDVKYEIYIHDGVALFDEIPDGELLVYDRQVLEGYLRERYV